MCARVLCLGVLFDSPVILKLSKIVDSLWTKKKKKLELENMKHLCDKWSGMCLQLQQYGRKDCPKGGFNSQRSLFIYYSLLFLFVLVCITLVLRFPPDSFAFYHHQVFFFFFNSVLKLISIFWKYKCGGGVWGDWVGRCDDDDDEIRSPRRWLWQKKKKQDMNK